MKLVKRAIRSARKIRQRGKVAVERGVLSHSFASFFDALPTTPDSDEGFEAFSTLCIDTMNELSPDRIVVADADEPKLVKNGRVILVSGNASGARAVLQAVETGLPFGLWHGKVTTLKFCKELSEKLPNCLAIHAIFEGINPEDAASDAIEVTEHLISEGFEPVIRSPARGSTMFRVLFVRRDRMTEVSPFLRARIEVACGAASRNAAQRNAGMPVYIPCFNNQTYCRSMIKQLAEFGFEDITLVDNASSSPEMHQFLDEVESQVNVDRLTENLGPKRSIFTPERFAKMPRHFCVTDPDIVFNPFLPEDFLDQLIAQTKTHEVGKAGFALDIMHRQFFSDTVVNLLYQEWKIWEWEERFWANPIGTTRTNDTVYRADVDTTFALYDKEHFVRDDFCVGVRVGGRFTAGHAPWYAQSDVPEDERDAYRSNSAFSYYKM